MRKPVVVSKENPEEDESDGEYEEDDAKKKQSQSNTQLGFSAVLNAENACSLLPVPDEEVKDVLFVLSMRAAVTYVQQQQFMDMNQRAVHVDEENRQMKMRVLNLERSGRQLRIPTAGSN